MSYFKNSKEYQLKKHLNFWVVCSAFLLFSNCLLTGLCWYTSVHQKIEVTPFFGKQGYIKEGGMVDASYLDQMSENFVLARLNVTPENIKDNHKRLLSYVDASVYALLSKALLEEQRNVIGQGISTYFDIKEISSMPARLQSEVKGKLRRFVGIKELPAKEIHYRLSYANSLGRIHLVGFEHVNQEGERHV